MDFELSLISYAVIYPLGIYRSISS